MILIDEVKYSCIECIRGHRSSSCRHHARPLLQVRSKGRPNVHANGNPNHRIAVFAEEIAPEIKAASYNDDSSKSPSPDTVVKCKKNPVVILKASPKQVMDLISGQIIGPYNENLAKPREDERPPPPIINSDSFIVTSTCCSGNGTLTGPIGSKISKQSSCGCCSNKSKKNINKSKILKNYIQKHFTKNNNKNNNNIDLDKDIVNVVKAEPIVQTVPQLQSQRHPNASEPFQVQHNQQQVYDVVPIPSCSIPGSCCCDDNCSCEGCVVHGNATINDVNKFLPTFSMDYIADESNFNTISDTNIILNSISAAVVNFTEQQQRQQQQSQSQSQQQQQQQQEPQAVSDETTTTSTTTSVSIKTESEDHPVSQATSETDSPYSQSCNCPPDSCDCANCETHGIINGLKLDDYFGSNLMDQKLLSLMSDFQPDSFNEYIGSNLDSINGNGITTSNIIPEPQPKSPLGFNRSRPSCCEPVDEIDNI
ncbi:uncharacterized protein RJT21DRAFT_20342 [Scheffersomyces amazonensis]|uniref:uncharacterized protein n=1 Tax=Scheffersomyces amazonensis TaxID=1078765 RepID=UPI00315DE967